MSRDLPVIDTTLSCLESTWACNMCGEANQQNHAYIPICPDLLVLLCSAVSRPKKYAYSLPKHTYSIYLYVYVCKDTNNTYMYIHTLISQNYHGVQ